MTTQAVAFMGQWSGKVPQDSLLPLIQRVAHINSVQATIISTIKLKSPVTGLVLGFLPYWLGISGIDRIYKGDIWLGLLKLFLPYLGVGLAIALVWAISHCVDEVDESVPGYIAAVMVYGSFLASFVWWFADLFLVWRGIKRDNLAKINKQLAICAL